ncbi:MAG: PilZ domain-containing protein [Nitrospira sp.]|nr:PilZ domain-containing protein [Nitrospira sp.]
MSSSRPQRIQVQCPVQFTHEDGVTGQGIMLNMSMGGCAIQSDTPVFDNMLVTMQFTPSEGHPPVTIEMGQVCWATLHEFGVKFLMVLPRERARLDRFLMTAVSVSGPPPAAAA